MTITKEKIIGIIPARYNSTRLEGKPLMDICGKPMIWWVHEQAKKVSELAEIYVATDDIRIKSVCESFGIKVILTSNKHPNGTDRIAEVASKIDSDIIIDIQGDEPLIEPEIIRKVIKFIQEDSERNIVMLKTEFKDPVDVVNSTTAKIVANESNDVLFISRSPIPYPKASLKIKYFKALGIYGFRSKILETYKNLPQGPVELAEEIELIRFIENRINMKVYEVESESMAVDTQKDLEKVREIIKNKTNKI